MFKNYRMEWTKPMTLKDAGMRYSQGNFCIEMQIWQLPIKGTYLPITLLLLYNFGGPKNVSNTNEFVQQNGPPLLTTEIARTFIWSSNETLNLGGIWKFKNVFLFITDQGANFSAIRAVRTNRRSSTMVDERCFPMRSLSRSNFQRN